MSASPELLGFLTVTENPRYGLIGGYLILNSSGRPIEFHCTTPVRASRAQEILYGSTLKPFLCGEQIAMTLIQRSKVQPVLFLTNISAVLAAQEFLDVPLCCLIVKNEEMKIAQQNSENEVDSLEEIVTTVPGLDSSHWKPVQIGRNQLIVPELSKLPLCDTISRLEILAANMNISEPFERIQLALEEAQKAA